MDNVKRITKILNVESRIIKPDFELLKEVFTYGLVAKIPYPKECSLFIYSDMYTYKMADELSLAAYYTEHYLECYNIVKKLLDEKLVPDSDLSSRLIINGDDSGETTSADYFRNKAVLREMITERYKEIESLNELVIIEGAGSPAERPA